MKAAIRIGVLLGLLLQWSAVTTWGDEAAKDPVPQSQPTARADAPKGLAERVAKIEAVLIEKQESLPKDRYSQGFPDHRALYALVQSDLQQLARTYGQDAVPFLKEHLAQKDHWDSSVPFVVVGTLEAIGPGKQTAEALLPYIQNTKRRDAGFIMLCVLFCSDETRMAMADAIAEKTIDTHRIPSEFLIVCGGLRTAELLDKAEEANPWPKGGKPFTAAAARIRARLNLPREKREQYSHDALLFLQTLADAPIPASLRPGLTIAAQRVVARKEKVSWDFLRDVLQCDDVRSYERKWLALDLIVAQKEFAALPVLKDIAVSKSPLARDAQAALKNLQDQFQLTPP